MKYIAHRGLFAGPDSSKENHPDQIMAAIKNGYDVEVDLWLVNSEPWLGHDCPQYPVPPEFLDKFELWIHAKNLAALRWLIDRNGCKYFWHENDQFTLTSNNLIWTYPGCELTTRSILVMPEVVDKELHNAYNSNCYAICSDYVERIKAVKDKCSF